MKKQPKLSEKELHNPKKKKSIEKGIDERRKNETKYEYVAVETDNSGF